MSQDLSMVVAVLMLKFSVAVSPTWLPTSMYTVRRKTIKTRTRFEHISLRQKKLTVLSRVQSTDGRDILISSQLKRMKTLKDPTTFYYLFLNTHPCDGECVDTNPTGKLRGQRRSRQREGFKIQAKIANGWMWGKKRGINLNLCNINMV